MERGAFEMYFTREIGVEFCVFQVCFGRGGQVRHHLDEQAGGDPEVLPQRRNTGEEKQLPLEIGRKGKILQ